jgi:threonine dehydrogenase-like Zn-dependent dehydrogenase
MRLQTDGAIDLKPIISHVIPLDDAAEAFRILDQEPANALQVVLDCTKI